MKGFIIIAMLVMLPAQSLAAIIYADNTLPGPCSGNYSINNRACNGSDGNAYHTQAGAVAAVQPGDTIYVRAGTWGGTGRWDFSGANKTGTASAWITLAGYPGERPVFQYAGTGTYGVINARGARAYFIFRNFVIDGINTADTTEWAIRDGNHDFILEDIEFKNIKSNGLSIVGNNVRVSNCIIHDLIEHPTSRRYAIYLRSGTNAVIENSDLYNAPGGGIHVYSVAGESTPGAIIRNNRIHHNNWMNSSPVSGIHLFNESGGISDMQIYNNLIYKNGLLNTRSTPPGGITVSTGVVRAKIYNNTIYGNHGWGVNMQSGVNGPPVDTEVKNNIIVGNIDGQVINAGTNTTLSYNACLSGDACGSTGKVTLTSATQPFKNAATDDYTLAQGTNPVRDAGTSVALPNPAVGTRDIGAYEQGGISSAVVVGTVIEVTTSISTPPLLPATGITGFTITCVGCTGTPVATANLKPGATGVVHVSISGLSSSGSCTISLGATNATDSGYVGSLSAGTAQGLNSRSGLSVSGTCANTSGIGGGGGGVWSRFLLEDGSGTTAADDSGLSHDGTVSAGVTWVTGTDGGVTIPNNSIDSTYRHISTTYGAGINPTSQSFAQCAYVVLDLASLNTVVMSAGGNGTGQRAYVGAALVGGQPQWGIGVQNSTFLGGSEFIATASATFICMVFDSTVDTAYLWVNGVKGTTSGSVKTYTSYVLVDALRVGNDGTFPNNNGGFTVYGIWTWNTAPSDADIITLYESLAPVGTPIGGLQQVTHAWQLITTDGTNPVSVGVTGQSITIPDGGGVALRIQIDCTGAPCDPLAFRFFCSLDDVTYIEIPNTLGALGIALWGTDTTPNLNAGATTGRITGALTPTPGVTLTTAAVSPTVTLAQDSSYEVRLLLKIGTGLSGQSRYILAKQDNGLDLTSAPAIGAARIVITNLMSSAIFH